MLKKDDMYCFSHLIEPSNGNNLHRLTVSPHMMLIVHQINVFKET